MRFITGDISIYFKGLKMSRKIVHVDAITGEIVDGYFAFIQRPRKSPFERHFTMNMDALKILAHNLKGENFKVLMILLGYLDYENMILIEQKKIADELNMKQSNVARSINKLADIGVILRGPKFGRGNSYKLNPSFGWRGTVTNHKKVLKERMSKAGLSIIE